MEKMIDLRSDTLTKPSKEMLAAMSNAEVGDDVYKEDPTVNELEEYVADLFGKEAALFVPTGVMGNQICLNVLTSPTDEVICHRDAHIFHFESGSPAALSGIQLYPVDGKNGIINPNDILPLIRPTSAYYMPRTRVIALENTHNMAGGTIVPLSNIEEISLIAEKHNLYFHLDGARIWNASVATGIKLSDYTNSFDTVSACLSKGLGTPVGSVIVGTKGLIQEAYRVRKGWGGGMRQVGYLAAAGLYAIKNNFERLSEDHLKAKNIANNLSELETIEIDLDTVQTNIIMFKPKFKSCEEVLEETKKMGLLISTGKPGILRIVTHLDVSTKEIEKAIEILQKVLK